MTKDKEQQSQVRRIDCLPDHTTDYFWWIRSQTHASTTGLTAVADDEGRGDEALDRGEILMLVLNDVDQDLGGQAADLREGLLDAGDSRIQKVQETVVVERNDAHLLRNPYAKLAESADGTKQDG